MTARCIWITEDDLAAPLDSAFREIMRAKFKASPADPYECARSAIGQCNRYVTTLDEVTKAVLRALGHPTEGD